MENIDRIVEIVELGTKVVLFVISLLATFATTKLPAKWKGEGQAAVLAAEARMRDALHSAARSGVEAGKQAGLQGHELLTFALMHMLKSVPDSIIGLIPGTKDLLKSGPADEILRRLPSPVRKVLENIVVSKVDPTLNDLRSGGWVAPRIPTGPTNL